jgi:hypothetical protein
LRRKVETDLPKSWTAWPGGWPGEIEVALIDAVFSIQARYTSALHVVGRWREHRGQASLDDLGELTRFEENPEQFVGICCNRQMVPGRSATKAQAVVKAAVRLRHAGVDHADQFDVNDVDQRMAYVGVPGLGEVTWLYLGMLLGQPGVKADTMIRRFVAASQYVADIDADKARLLVEAVAADIGVNATTLDHAIWSHQRRQRG